MQNRITVCLEEDDRTKIETCIKQEYPRIKTVSALVRFAIEDFLNQTALHSDYCEKRVQTIEGTCHEQTAKSPKV